MRDFTQCRLCGNHTVRAHNCMCMCCDTVAPLPRPRYTAERVIIAVGLMFAVAFMLVILTGHVRAQQAYNCPPNSPCSPIPFGQLNVISAGSGVTGTYTTSTLVIRSKEKKTVLIRGINSFEQCQSIMGGLNTSPDIEFAECFR
jgi:hypothetical protein